MVDGGLGGVLQTLFGRIYFPNALNPIWMIEGLAVYEETEQTSGGRGRSPGFDMIIRMAVLENRFPNMGQATVYPDFWPGADVPVPVRRRLYQLYRRKVRPGRSSPKSLRLTAEGISPSSSVPRANGS